MKLDINYKKTGNSQRYMEIKQHVPNNQWIKEEKKKIETIKTNEIKSWVFKKIKLINL